MRGEEVGAEASEVEGSGASAGASLRVANDDRRERCEATLNSVAREGEVECPPASCEV